MNFFRRLIIGAKLFIALLLYPFFKKRYENSWMIFERENNADDNGWIFYQWIKKHHPEQKIFFLLGKKAIKDLGLKNDPQIVKWELEVKKCSDKDRR